MKWQLSKRSSPVLEKNLFVKVLDKIQCSTEQSIEYLLLLSRKFFALIFMYNVGFL